MKWRQSSIWTGSTTPSTRGHAQRPPAGMFSLFKKSPSVKVLFIYFFFILTTDIKCSIQQLARKENWLQWGDTIESCTVVFGVESSGRDELRGTALGRETIVKGVGGSPLEHGAPCLHSTVAGSVIPTTTMLLSQVQSWTLARECRRLTMLTRQPGGENSGGTACASVASPNEKGIGGVSLAGWDPCPPPLTV